MKHWPLIIWATLVIGGCSYLEQKMPIENYKHNYDYNDYQQTKLASNYGVE